MCRWAEPMHFECVACHARSVRQLPEDATLTLIVMMLRDGLDARDLLRGLCFAHRRAVEDCVQAE